MKQTQKLDKVVEQSYRSSWLKHPLLLYITLFYLDYVPEKRLMELSKELVQITIHQSITQ